MSSTARPSASRRRRPRSTASAATRACATLNETVALTLTPRYVASSITRTPTLVAGNLTMMFGARRSKPIPCSSMRSYARKKVGSVCIDSRPCRPRDASNAGSSKGAARSDISSTIAHARSTSVASGRSTARVRTRSRQRSRIRLPDVDHDRRVGRRTDRTERDRRIPARRQRRSRSRCRSRSSRWSDRVDCRPAATCQRTGSQASPS